MSQDAANQVVGEVIGGADVIDVKRNFIDLFDSGTGRGIRLRFGDGGAFIFDTFIDLAKRE